MGYIELPENKLKEIANDPAEGPIVMLNLLRFKGEAGKASYMRYIELVGPLMEKCGGRLVYGGDAKLTMIGPEQWDMVILGEYPNRTVLTEMLASPEYQGIAHYRQDALEDSRLILTEAFPK